jgi:hypothetical protein
MTDLEQANVYMNQGYRRVSNKFCMLSRIDRSDWREHLAELHAPWDPLGQGKEWAALPFAEDWYRRCVSKDVITVSSSVSRLVDTSGHDRIGFVPKDTQ